MVIIKRRLSIGEIELLDTYSRWLEEHGYLDADRWCEEPKAIDEFIKTLPGFKEDKYDGPRDWMGHRIDEP